MWKKYNFIVVLAITMALALSITGSAFAMTSAQSEFNSNIAPEIKSFTGGDKSFTKLYNKYKEATFKLNDLDREQINPKDEYYKNNWIQVLPAEGEYYYALNYKHLANEYKNRISREYYLWLMFLEKNQRTVEDGGLMVNPDKIREYLIFTEEFMKKYPDFVLIEDVELEQIGFRSIYLFGIENTPVFDLANGNRMNPDYKKSYEKFLKKNKTSKFCPEVKEFYNKAKENNFVRDDNFEKWHYKTFNDKYFKY